MENSNLLIKKLEFVMAVVMLSIIYICSVVTNGEVIGVYNQTKDKVVVMIDAGHGGNDPGKVSLNNDFEKDINLEIALKLRDILVSQDIIVVMTRETDTGLYEEGAKNKKTSDMKNRVELIEEKQVDIMISIHANSYVDENVCGAQVFYYKSSADGENLAKHIQKNISKVSSLNNKREAKSNGDYYLLKKSNVPAVIVECGFLSNVVELAMLKDENYQRQIAWSIHLGLMEYINDKY